MVLRWAVISVPTTVRPAAVSCSVTASSGSFGGLSASRGGGMCPWVSAATWREGVEGRPGAGGECVGVPDAHEATADVEDEVPARALSAPPGLTARAT